MPPHRAGVNNRTHPYAFKRQFFQTNSPTWLTPPRLKGYGTVMKDKPPVKTMSDKHNSFHAEKRRLRRDAGNKTDRKRPGKRPRVQREDSQVLYLFGLHTVRNALQNRARNKVALFATVNGLARLELDPASTAGLTIEEKLPKELDRMVGSDAVHQGVVLQAEPLQPKKLDALGDTDLVLVLDQVTDPHNVGAILRSAVALGAGAVITTSRYSPVESGVLAKSASGALDMIDHIEVRNLADALDTLAACGFATIGLDSEEAEPLENVARQDRIALVLGAEGKGLRQKTREHCKLLARLDLPGAIRSLNVSNAAVLSLYLSRKKLGDPA